MSKYFNQKRKMIPERSWDSLFREINGLVNGHVSSTDPKEQNKTPDYVKDWIELNPTSPAE